MAHETVSNRYRLVDTIGQGGMGIVYRADDRLIGRTVALKRVTVLAEQIRQATMGKSSDYRLALAQEFKTLATLRHPHIISVLDYGFDSEQQPYFTMDYLENAQNIQQAAQGQSLERQVDLLIETLQALDYLHRRSVIHRDLKPDNVLVVDNTIKVLDFGLALDQGRVTSQEQDEDETSGTLAYMAPEIITGGKASRVSDLYAVGMIAYELFAGHHPFETPNIAQMLNSILNEQADIDQLDCSVELSAIIERLLDKDPKRRFQSASQVIEALSLAVGRPAPEETEAIRESFLKASEFVGRKEELRRLEAVLDAVEETQKGAIWLIGGESGVGKSRLLDELRIRALVAGIPVLRGQGTIEERFTYQSWRDPLRRLVIASELSDLEASVLKQALPDIDTLIGRKITQAATLPGGADRQRFALTLVDLLKQQEQPSLVMLEDLQWDSNTVDVLHQLQAHLDELPVLIVGTYRSDEKPNLPEQIPQAETMMLHRLESDDIRALSSTMLGTADVQPALVELLQRETEGNVFFLIEVVRTLAEDAGSLRDIGKGELPKKVFAGGVIEIVRRRLAQVPGWAQPLLKIAAVAGRQIDLKVLQHIKPSKLDDHSLSEWLSAAANTAVIEVQDGQWRFSHDKLRESLLGEISAEESKSLNRAVALAIEAAYPNDPTQAIALADHWHHAENTEKETHYTLIAGETLVNGQAVRQGLRLVERAIARREEPSLQLLYMRAEAWFNLGEYKQSQADFDTVIKMTDDEDNLRVKALALRGLGRIMTTFGEMDKAKDYTQQAIETSREAGDEFNEAKAVANLGMINAYMGRFDDAWDQLMQGLETLQKVGDKQAISSAFNALGNITFWRGEMAESRKYHEESLKLKREFGDRRGIAISLMNLSEYYNALGEFDKARSHTQEALQIVQEVGDKLLIAGNLNQLGDFALMDEDLETAKDYYTQSLELRKEMGDKRGQAGVIGSIGTVYYHMGDYQQAIQHQEEGMAMLREINNVPDIAENLYNLIRTYLRVKDYDKATAGIIEGLELGEKSDDMAITHSSLINTARMKIQQGDIARGAALIGLIENSEITDQRKMQDVLDDHKAKFETEAAQTGRKSGHDLDLKATCQEIIKELKPD